MLDHMNTNPETLKYKLGQQIVWKGDSGEEQKGQVRNIAHWGVEVESADKKTRWISFELVLN
jgi:hypothetical protein